MERFTLQLLSNPHFPHRLHLKRLGRRSSLVVSFEVLDNLDSIECCLDSGSSSIQQLQPGVLLSCSHQSPLQSMENGSYQTRCKLPGTVAIDPGAFAAAFGELLLPEAKRRDSIENARHFGWWSSASKRLTREGEADDQTNASSVSFIDLSNDRLSKRTETLNLANESVFQSNSSTG